MSSRRVIALTGALVLTINARSLADPSLAELQKSVREAYGKIDRFSISCFAIQLTPGENAASAMGSIEYRYDRNTNQLAIGTGGAPYVLVQGKRLLLRAEYGDEDDGVYLLVNKPTPITWSDVDEACKTLRMHCPLADLTGLQVPSFVLPFLADGEQRLFAKTSKMLQGDDPRNQLILGLGHPDAVIRIGGDDRRVLDPKRAPVCVSSEDPAASWAYAFDRQTRLMSGARGIITLPSPVENAPARQMEVILKPWHSFQNGEFNEAREVSFELPPRTKVVEAAGLRAAYLEGLRGAGRQELLERKERWKEHAKAEGDRKTQLASSIAKQLATSGADAKQLEKDEAELKQLEADQAVYGVLVKELQAAIDGLEEKP